MTRSMIVAATVLAVALMATPGTSTAQLIATGPVTNGHHHFNVSDVDAHLRLWVDMLGGKRGDYGPNAMVVFPNALVLLRDQAPDGDMIGSNVNHVGFTVPDLRALVDKLKAAGYEFVTERDGPPGVPVTDHIAAVNAGPISGFAYVMGPDDIKVEILEIRTQDEPIVSHHLHFYAADPEAMQAWYSDVFGAVKQPGPFPGWASARLPGLSLNFTPTSASLAGTAGRTIDHIGFEIDDIEAFVAELAAKGIELDIPLREIPEIGLKLAFMSDPWGTYIELTEGLDTVR